VEPLRPGDPRQIGPYSLRGRLGSGAMGEVFLGFSLGNLRVAVKLMNPVLASDTDFRRRFRLEIEACRKVGGFHTAQVVDADLDAHRPWMVTAYVPGPSLKQVLASRHALPPDTVKVLGAGLAEALAAIHDAGLIHRDLKPSNILLTDDGPRVIDFGIARAVDASVHTTQPGTPGFMAPEVLTGEQATEACDVFALGVVLAVAAGTSPFGEGLPDAITTYRIVNEEPVLDGLDPEIRELVAQCLAKEPADRPTPREILGRLGAHASGTEWLPPEVVEMISRYPRPDPTEVALGGLLHDARLLEAERAARGIPDAYARAEAHVHVAATVSRFDADHAARLLDDALRPTTHRGATPLPSSRQLLRHLVGDATFELGTVLAGAEADFAAPMLDEIEDIIQSMVREEPGRIGNVITRLAEAVASTDPVRADRIAHIDADPAVQALAVARAAMVVARSDPARAEQMARNITRLPSQAIRSVAESTSRARPWPWQRPREAPHIVSTAAAPWPQDSARLWAARALSEVAVATSGTGPFQPRRPGSGTEDESTITARGVPEAGRRAPPGMMVSRVDPASPEQLLAAAEQLADGITSDDTRNLAMTAVTTAKARIDPGRAGPLLSRAEQFARRSRSRSAREEALGEIALAAARTEPSLAEQIARSFPDREHTVAEVASAVAVIDGACAERIAVAITDEYVHTLVMAEIATRTDSAHAELRVTEALQAAHHDPARMVEVAMVAARTDPARAEEIVHAIRSRDNVKTADFWKARALADLAGLSYEKRPGT
jgi:Protein kinase domain